MKAALYYRVSTEEQARHGLSIDAQKDALTEWANANNLKIVGYYGDEGISARKPASKRAELQRLLSDVEAGKVELILFTKLDRWTRNVKEYHKCQEILDRYNVAWKAIQEDYETQTAGGRFKVNIMLAVAENEADRTSERIKFIMDSKRQKKEALTGNCPTGYLLDGKKLIKDKNTEEAVTTFFRTYLDTASTVSAVEAAQEKGLQIQMQLAHKMLHSPAYYGYYYDTDDMCPAYITKEEFEQIQKIRKKYVRKSPSRTYVFSGLVVCAECGHRMSGKINSKNTKYYNCANHYAEKRCGNKTNISESVLERAMLDNVDGLLKARHAVIEEEREADHTSEIAALKRKMARVNDLYIADLIDLEKAKCENAKCQAKIEELQMRPKQKKIELPNDWKTMYFELTEKQKNVFWRKFIERIEIDKDRTISVFFM